MNDDDNKPVTPPAKPAPDLATEVRVLRGTVNSLAITRRPPRPRTRRAPPASRRPRVARPRTPIRLNSQPKDPMPIGFGPNDTATFHLDCFDKGKPDAERAKFTFRFQTGGQQVQVERLRDEAARAESNTATNAKLNEAILLSLVRWENLRDDAGNPVPFSPEALDDFTLRAKFAIASEYPWTLAFSDPDRPAPTPTTEPKH